MRAQHFAGGQGWAELAKETPGAACASLQLRNFSGLHSDSIQNGWLLVRAVFSSYHVPSLDGNRNHIT